MSRVVETFAEKGLFSLEEAQKVLGGEKASLVRHFHYLAQKGRLRGVRRGLYFVAPPGGNARPDPFVVASKIVKPYYIGFHSALEIHGVAYAPHRTIFIAANKRFASFEFENVLYRWVKPLTASLNLGIEERMISGAVLYVSDREKTVIDCLDRIDYAGGVEECIKSLRNFPSIDAEKLLEYLLRIQRKVLFAKTGWLLEMMQTEWHIGEQILALFEKQLSARPMYLQRDSDVTQIYVSRWKLHIPENLNELLRGV